MLRIAMQAGKPKKKNSMGDLTTLEKKLGLKFKNKDLLTQAFIHRSYLNENPNFHLAHNERMEFLGDAVLELAVTEYLYKEFPKEPEGELTTWRAALVNAPSLSQIAKELDFNGYLLLSRGEAKDTGKARDYILANCLEAFIGALYLDQGYKKSKEFVDKVLIKKLPEILKHGLFRDSKSHFQEQSQEKEKITPAYKVLEEEGPDHAKNFVIGVYLGEKLIAKGEGSSKQEAEEQAAKNALKINNW